MGKLVGWNAGFMIEVNEFLFIFDSSLKRYVWTNETVKQLRLGLSSNTGSLASVKSFSFKNVFGIIRNQELYCQNMTYKEFITNIIQIYWYHDPEHQNQFTQVAYCLFANTVHARNIGCEWSTAHVERTSFLQDKGSTISGCLLCYRGQKGT